MDERANLGAVADVAAAQRGVVSRSQALQAGMSPNALRWRVRRGGPWRVVFPGVYATFTGPVDDRRRWQAALVYGGEDAVLTGLPALLLAGVSTKGPTGPIPVLIPHDRRRRSVPGVLAMRTRRAPQVRDAEGLPVVEPVRALADACRLTRELDVVRDLVTECLEKRRVSLAALRWELRTGPTKGSALLRRVLAEYREGIRSVAEAQARDKLVTLDLPRPVFNVNLYLPDGTFLCRPDAYWPDAGLAFEVDSRKHHGDVPGQERTQRRHALMSSYGLAVIHASPYRIRTDWLVLAEELTAAYEHGRLRPRPPIEVCPTA